MAATCRRRATLPKCDRGAAMPRAIGDYAGMGRGPAGPSVSLGPRRSSDPGSSTREGGACGHTRRCGFAQDRHGVERSKGSRQWWRCGKVPSWGLVSPSLRLS